MEQTESRYRPTSSRRLSLLLLTALLAPLPLLARGGQPRKAQAKPRPAAQQRAKPKRPATVAASARQQAPTPSPATPPGQGIQQIDITGGSARAAIPPCIARAGDEASREACRTVTEVLRKDLAFENAFRFVPDNLIGAIPPLNPDVPNFVDWQGIGANLLIATRAQVTGGELAVELKVYFVDNGQNLLSKRYTGKADNPRSFAHQASDDIMALTQYRGVARTKIAFVSDRDCEVGRRCKELYVADYDGFNVRRVTVNKSINILPNWNPDGRSLAYVSFRRKNESPDAYVAHIFEGRSANLTEGRGGAVLALAFSPDGKKIAYASSRGGNTEIWVANADGSSPRRMTSSTGADTAPSWSPTGQEIAFTSDRGGTPQLYVMDAESGLNVRRLTTVGSWNDAPAWNPSKQFAEIAFTSRIEGGFQVAVIDLASRQVRQITEGRGSCEYPSWAPSGRHLTFACGRGAKWQIAVADRQGQTFTVLPAGPGKNEQPDWGP